MVDVSRAVFLVPQVAFLFQNSQKRPDGRGHRRIGKLFANLGRRGMSAPVDDVHDLAFATTEMGCLRRGASHDG